MSANLNRAIGSLLIAFSLYEAVKWSFFLLMLLLIASCDYFKSHEKDEKHHFSIPIDSTKVLKENIPVRQDNDSVLVQQVISPLEQRLIDSGLVNIRLLDSGIFVDLRYSTADNFLDSDLYGELQNCYLQMEVAEKLIRAQQLLKNDFPQYSIIVFDGVRPRSIQHKMWEMLQMPEKEKVRYVSNPKYGSLHNFGAAVDVSIVDENGNELDMGTPYDFFGELAWPIKEKELLKEGRLTVRQVENRKLLRKVMYGADFFNIQTEWWHFNSCYRKEAAKKFPLIE